jgi:saccharopine dehydrogenase (NADP+, L-glutamate forming)
MKTVLVLGAGLVTRPLVRYLLDSGDINVTVASRTVSKAEALIAGHSRGKALELDVENNPSALRQLIPDNDVVISLLPYTYHVLVAQVCVENKTNMVTTSYVSPPMRALDSQAQEADVILLNEIGVDPGIDHMSAMKIIHSVQENGGEIASFRSWCGGLPAPEANTNPLGYKFSWSPRGVLLAGRNPAHYIEDGQEITIAGENLFEHYWPVDVPGMEAFEGYPNRDAVPYADVYGIQSAKTVFRGTLRYSGWCTTLKALVDLRMLELAEDNWSGLTYGGLLARLVGYGGQNIRSGVRDFLGLEDDSFVLDNLEWLGLFSDAPLPVAVGAPIDILTACMLEKMRYEDNERDMLVMQHEFVATYPGRTEEITSTMIDFGIPGGDSSMSRTVGLPAAIATKLILDGAITRKGVVVPVTADIYEPVLAELDQLGIRLEESSRRA